MGEAVLVKALVYTESGKLRFISQNHIKDAIGAVLPEGWGGKLAGGDVAKRTFKNRIREPSFSQA